MYLNIYCCAQIGTVEDNCREVIVFLLKIDGEFSLLSLLLHCSICVLWWGYFVYREASKIFGIFTGYIGEKHFLIIWSTYLL